MYSESDLHLVRLVAQLRAAGLGLADIREVIGLRELGVPPPDAIIALLAVRVASVDRELSDLHQRRTALTDLLEQMRAGGPDVRLCQVVGGAPNAQS
jgi:DNA-binding transcriptional MerR regulator